MHAFYFREVLRSLRHHRGLASTGVFSLTAGLAIAGLFLLLTHNARVALKLIGDRREMVVYLRDEVSPADRDSLIERIRQLYGSVTYVSKKQAWDEFVQQVGDASLLEAVDQNPLPASLRVRLKPDLLNYAAMEQTAQQVAQFPEVEDVRYGAEWVRRLDRLGEELQRGTMAVGILVALAILFVVYNTIRLTVLARRDSVEIMSRLGATDSFISAPFVLEAVVIAALAALVALAALFGLQQGVSARVVGMVFLPWSWVAAFVGSSVLLAGLAGWLAASRVLRAVGP